MQDTDARERGREVVRAAQHVPQELTADTPRQAEVIENRRPAHVHGALLGFVGRVAAREIQFAQLRQLTNRLIEALEGNRFGHKGQVEDAETYAFAQ